MIPVLVKSEHEVEVTAMEEPRWKLFAPNLICIGMDGCKKNEYAGRIWHQYADDPIPFRDAVDMLRIMEELYDEWNFPQSSTKSHSFIETGSTKEPKQKKGARAKMDVNRIHNKHGNRGTFIVQVKYRQNSTWQGEVIWAERNQKQSFRSALELLKLIDGALDLTEEEEEPEKQFPAGNGR